MQYLVCYDYVDKSKTWGEHQKNTHAKENVARRHLPSAGYGQGLHERDRERQEEYYHSAIGAAGASARRKC